MNIETSDELKKIQESFISISEDKTYNEKLYKAALDLYYSSEFFLKLNEEQQGKIKAFFIELENSMHQPQQLGKFKLPNKFYFDVWKNAIESFTHIRPEEIKGVWSFKERFNRNKSKLQYVINSDNKFENDIASLIWDIYNREDLSIGIHGTSLPDDFDISEQNCDFFKHGIMVDRKYKTGDARRTVNFQDLPGKQWAFGHISFLGLMNYQYSSMNNRNQSDQPYANYSCIVVKPSSMKDTSYDENCPQEYSIVTPQTSIKTNRGNYLSGHLIKPEYILGIFKNNEIFVRNPRCDLDRIAALNKPIQERTERIKRTSMKEKLMNETKDISATAKQNVFNAIKRMFTKDRTRGNPSKGER